MKTEDTLESKRNGIQRHKTCIGLETGKKITMEIEENRNLIYKNVFPIILRYLYIINILYFYI